MCIKIQTPSHLFQINFNIMQLVCCDRGFDSHRRHEHLSAVSVVCCQVDISATDWSLA